MAVRYLLLCCCGESIEVEVRQAGGQIRCPSCQEIVDVPRLGKLRQLPQANRPADATPTREWTGQHSLAAIAMIVAVVATAVATYMWTHEESESGIRDQAAVETGQLIDRLSPPDAWNYWQDFKSKVEAYGFDSVRSYARLQRQFSTARYARLKNIWLGVAAAGAVVALVIGCWPVGKART